VPYKLRPTKVVLRWKELVIVSPPTTLSGGPYFYFFRQGVWAMSKYFRHRGAADSHSRKPSAALWPENGGSLSSNTIALNSWSIGYYETMVAAEKARIEVEVVKRPDGFVEYIGQFILRFFFRAVIRDTEKLISKLTELETFPSSLLLEKNAENIPTLLRELFRKMCDVLQASKAKDFHKTLLLGPSIERLSELSQLVIGFADRYEDAQNKLRSRVSAEEVTHYRDAFEAYGNSSLMPEQATDEDVKSHLLHI
jgi:hypothetical protein